MFAAFLPQAVLKLHGIRTSQARRRRLLPFLAFTAATKTALSVGSPSDLISEYPFPPHVRPQVSEAKLAQMERVYKGKRYSLKEQARSYAVHTREREIERGQGVSAWNTALEERKSEGAGRSACARRQSFAGHMLFPDFLSLVQLQIRPPCGT